MAQPYLDEAIRKKGGAYDSFFEPQSPETPWLHATTKTLHVLLEIVFKGAVLHGLPFVKHALGLFLRLFHSATTFTNTNISTIETKKLVHSIGTIRHGHKDVVLRLQLDIVQKHVHKTIEGVQFVCGQIVFGHNHIARMHSSLTGPPFQEVRPMCGASGSQRSKTSSAAVWPVTAKCILFWIVA